MVAGPERRSVGHVAGRGPEDEGPRMRIRMWAAALALAAVGGTALAQTNMIAERRAGLKRMGEHMEAMKPIADARGDPRPAVARIEDMIA